MATETVRDLVARLLNSYDIDDRTTSTVLAEIQDELDNEAVDPATDPWGLVIDQAVGLAAVYDIDPGSPTTPDELHDLWAKVIVAIAEGARSDALAEADHLRAAANSWHELTESLGPLLATPPEEVHCQDGAPLWSARIRGALWRAFGLGRRWQAQGTGQRFDPLEIGSPFNLKYEDPEETRT